MGGNIATQSSSIIVRGLATGRVDLGHYFSTIGKEFLLGIVLGTLFGIILGLLAHVKYQVPVNLGLVVGLSVAIVMTAAATVGTTVPLVLKKLHVDPAVATGPFITTTIDVLGVTLYFSIAKFFLHL